MANKNRQKAQRMASRGATAKEIRQATGIKAPAARNIVSRAAAASAPSAPAPSAPSPSVLQISRQNSVSQNLRAAQDGGVTRNELKQIAGNPKNYASVIKRMDAMNKKGKDLRLNSGAANAIAKKAAKKPTSVGLGFGLNPFGTGNIGRAVAGMIGDPGSPGAMVKGQRVGGREATPGTGLMIGGTQIRKGGRVAVRGLGTGNTQQPTPEADPTPTNTDTGTGTGSDLPPFIPPELPLEEEEQLPPGPGMMSGGGLGALGANKLNRAKSRLRQLGIYGRGTGLLGRGLQYGNALNA